MAAVDKTVDLEAICAEKPELTSAYEEVGKSVDEYAISELGLPVDQYVGMYSKTDIDTAYEMYIHGMSTIFAPLLKREMAGLDQTAKLREQYPELFI